MKRLTQLLLCAVSLSCATEIDVKDVASIAGYREWKSVSSADAIPGHGDTFRVTYYNDIAEAYPHGGRYAVGTIFVKDIHAKTSDGGQGGLKYTAVMRKVGKDAPGDLPTDNEWLFTVVDGLSENHSSACYSTCHKQGPYDSAWRDYGN
jgi:hypothetical protein